MMRFSIPDSGRDMLASLAVKVLVETPPAKILSVDRAHDKARIGLRAEVSNLGHHAPLFEPAAQGPVPEVLVAPRRDTPDERLATALLHPGGHHSLQALLFGQAEDVVDSRSLAKGHDSLMRKGAVPADNNLNLRPGLPDRLDEATKAKDRPFRGVDVRGAQYSRQAEVPAKDVERQVAVAKVVAVKKATFLPPVQRVVGRVKIKYNSLWGSVFLRLPSLQERLDEKRLDLLEMHRDFLVPGRPRRSLLPAVQRTFSGQRLASVSLARAALAGRVRLADHRRQKLIAANLVVMIEILVSERQGVNALAQEVKQLRLGPIRVAMIGKSLGKAGN